MLFTFQSESFKCFLAQRCFKLQCACFCLMSFALSMIILLLLCPFSLCLLLSHACSPSLPSDAKEVIIDALCHDCSRDLCANYFDSRVIIIGRVSHNYGFAFHSHDMICLNGVLIVCNFDRLLDIHIDMSNVWWGSNDGGNELFCVTSFPLPPSLANQISHDCNNWEVMNGSSADYVTVSWEQDLCYFFPCPCVIINRCK